MEAADKATLDRLAGRLRSQMLRGLFRALMRGEGDQVTTYDLLTQALAELSQSLSPDEMAEAVRVIVPAPALAGLLAALDSPDPANGVFVGVHRRRLDDRGRIFLPARYRRFLGEVVITRGQLRCLLVFPASRFGGIARDLVFAPVMAEQDYTRLFFAKATDAAADRYGRVWIPQDLREYAGLDRDCIVVGADRWLEIWDAAAWAAYLTTQEETE